MAGFVYKSLVFHLIPGYVTKIWLAKPSAMGTASRATEALMASTELSEEQDVKEEIADLLSEPETHSEAVV